jgi:hypothetical protein
LNPGEQNRPIHSLIVRGKWVRYMIVSGAVPGIYEIETPRGVRELYIVRPGLERSDISTLQLLVGFGSGQPRFE